MWTPSKEEVNLLAGEFWLSRGGKPLSNEESVAIFFEAEAEVRRYHEGQPVPLTPQQQAKRDSIALAAHAEWVKQGRPFGNAELTFANWIDAELDVELPPGPPLPPPQNIE